MEPLCQWGSQTHRGAFEGQGGAAAIVEPAGAIPVSLPGAVVPPMVAIVASIRTRPIVVLIASITAVLMALATVAAGGACMGRC